ncbi:MAG: ABC transporter permease, partial [bacterium]
MIDTSTRGLTLRLWHSYVRQHGKGILLALACTLGVSGCTALYPIVIQQAFYLFTAGDQRVLWLIPGVSVLVTSFKALAQFGQAVAIQSVVLRVVENLQRDLFKALTRADLADVARDAPACHAARFTTDAGLIREALQKSINAIAD